MLWLSDEKAMLRVKTHGDQSAFALLVRRWERPIQRLCTRMTGDSHTGEDLAQEAFARLFAHRTHYRDGRRFSAFLRRIAVNLCHDERRRSRRREKLLPGREDDWSRTGACARTASEPLPHDALIEKERSELVRKALLRLPEDRRAVVVLRHYEGLKFREIAEVLDIPEGTVKSRMAEALTRLARLLQPTLGEGAARPAGETLPIGKERNDHDTPSA